MFGVGSTASYMHCGSGRQFISTEYRLNVDNLADSVTAECRRQSAEFGSRRPSARYNTVSHVDDATTRRCTTVAATAAATTTTGLTWRINLWIICYSFWHKHKVFSRCNVH